MLNKNILYYSVASVIGLFFLFTGLSKGQNILLPLTTAIILCLTILPMANFFEQKMKRFYASLLSTFLLFLISLAFIVLLSLQVKTFVEDWPQIKETMKPKIENLQDYLADNTPLKKSDLSVAGDSAATKVMPSGQETGKIALFAVGQFAGFTGYYLLTFVYIFFILNYRRRLKEFFFMLFEEQKKDEVQQILSKSANVVQQFLIGKLFLIAILAVLYAIGLGISGVNNFILVSLVAALFDLIPYVGNIVGFAMAMVFGYLSSGNTSVLIGIIITFSVAQFIQSYILEPYIVGDKVDLHPFFTIVFVVIGGAVWGIIGAILAIPVMAIVTVIFLHVPPLKPFGYLFSNKNKDEI